MQQSDPTLIDLCDVRYVCPPDAGPAWRAACESGEDMALIEENLDLAPIERLRAHARALKLMRMFRSAKRTCE